MTQYKNLVERRRLFLASEKWGNEIKMHYLCKGDVGDLGFGMGYFVYYNNGAVHRLNDNNSISIMQTPNSIEQVIDDYEVAHAITRN